MRHTTFVAGMAVLGLVVLAGCGGSGNGFGAPSNPLIITSSTLPTLQSGDTVDYMIPLGGGCSGHGPYVVEVIAGVLPDGIGTDDTSGNHHITGVLLESGNFSFTLKITDTSCTPFQTTIQAYTWEVAQGPIKIVGAVPGLIPVADYDDSLKWPDVDALEKVVYGSFISYKLVVAGGVPGPTGYQLSVIDDPTDANDDAGLPTGVAIPNNSTSFVGTPIQVGPGGKPFRISLRATDSVGATADIKLQWKVDTPPIIVANSSIADGQAGSNYADTLQIVDGVPPFRYELLDDMPTVANEDIVYNSPNAPTFPSASGFTVDAATGKASNMLFDGSAAAYPGTAVQGPYTIMPSEGLYLNIDTGGFGGVPRRAGTFTMFFHMCSTLVPNERGQHAFATYTHTIAPSEPPMGGNPAFALTPAFTVEGNAFLPGPTYSSIQEFEAGLGAYNPDGGPAGLQCTAVGGVPGDGYTDAPHLQQRAVDFTETPGAYFWEMDWNVNTPGFQPPPTGITSNAAGIIGVTPSGPALRTAREYLDIFVRDYQLPDNLQNEASERVGYSVGPDVVILSQSSQSNTGTYTYFAGGTPDNWDDHKQRIRKFKNTNSPTIVDLDGSDLPLTLSVPAAAGLGASGNPLADLLSKKDMDLLRVVVNATGYWDDVHGLNPHGANPSAHGDVNRDYGIYGNVRGYYYGWYYPYLYGYRYGNWQPNAQCVQLQDAENVPGGQDPLSGIYTDGGRLFAFETATHYGVFVIREDGHVYVPYASKKNTTYEGFGDGCSEVLRSSPVNSMFRIVHMTVSPDGRFGAMKILKDHRQIYSAAGNTSIVLFSLTGEKVFGGDTYKVISNGSSSTGSGNRVQYAQSMALSGKYLYFLIGSRGAVSGSDTSVSHQYYEPWSGHFIMRYEITGGASSASMLSSATGDSQWTQGSGTPMQTVFSFFGPNSISTSTGLCLAANSSGSYGIAPNGYYWGWDGMNMKEMNVAPHPFRVSRDGSTVAFFAAKDGSNYYGTDIWSNYCWVDTGDGARRVTSTRRRHLMGGARGYTIFDGPDQYGSCAWGRYTGPTPGVEISDDGSQIAFVYNTNQSYMYGSDYYYYAEQKNYRDNIILTSTTNGWSTYNERDVTQNCFYGAANTTSTSYIKWRFGSLAFTEDGTGLVFWAGGGNYYGNQTSYSYQASYVYAGSYFIHKVSDTNKVTTMCSTSEGGFTSAGKTYTSSSPRNPGTSGGVTYSRFGAIHPWGGFISRNRKFLYIVDDTATSSSDQTAGQLIGMNIQSANSGSYNGHTNGRAFMLSNWPQRRSFLVGHPYIYYNRYYQWYYGYGYGVHGNGCQVMSKDTGWVYWSSNNSYAGPTSTSSSSYAANIFSQYYYGCYSYGGAAVYGFNADMGGKVSDELEPSGLTATGTGTSPYGTIKYIEVTRDGSRLIYVDDSYSSYLYMNYERIYYITNLDFSGGNLSGSFNRNSDSGTLEGSNGRASEALSYCGPSQTAYYAYKAGAGNETQMEMVSATWNPSTKKYEKTAFSGLTGRMHILFATR